MIEIKVNFRNVVNHEERCLFTKRRRNKLEDFLGCGFSGFTPREVETICAVVLEAILTSVDVCLFLHILNTDM